MRKLLVAAGLGLLLFAPSASAQSLAGVSLGDTEAKALKALPGKPFVSPETKEDPNLRIIFSAKTTVWVCKGVVYSVQHEVGSTLTDYLSLVEAETAKHGKPVVTSGVSKVGSATQGWMNSEWPGRSTNFAIELRYNGKIHFVSSSVTGASTC